MNTDDRTRLRRFISNHRDSWDDAGIEAALVKLDQQFPNEPLRVGFLALQAAMNPAARTPEAMCRPEVIPQPMDRTPTPASLSVWCERHGCNAKIRDNGELSCCWAERIGADEPSGYVRAGVTAAPADFRERVEKAMAGAQAKETAENG